MKKFQKIFLVVCMVLSSVVIIKMDTTTAQAAVKKELIIQIGKTKIYNTSEDIVEGENWKYDKTTNTLTISSVDLSKSDIYSYQKLKIKASGENKIQRICVEDDYEKGYVRRNVFSIVGDENASIVNCSISSCSNLMIKNISMANCSIYATHTLDIANSFITETKYYASGIMVDNSTIESIKADYDVIYASNEPGRDGLIIKNSTININTDASTGVQLYGGKCSISDSTLNITAKEMGMYLSGGEDVTIKNCEMKLQTILGNGTLGCPLDVYSSDNFQILNSKITLIGKQCAMGTYNTATAINNSTLDITAKTDMGIWIMHGDDRVYSFTVDNSNVKINAAKDGIFSEGVKIILNSGKMNVTSKKKSGIAMSVKYSDPNIQPVLSINGGTCNINGKKYGIEFITESKSSLTGGTLTLNGDKAAVSMISKLPTGKTYAIKTGSSKNKAKTTTAYKKTDKYVSIKKK
ncbi:MAG: hypothetical protein ACI4EC_07885 [Lachnospiraceae bacterium]